MSSILKYKEFMTESAKEDVIRRGVDPKRTRVVYSDDESVAYFFLYNLSGKLIGYQRYNPKGSKKEFGNTPDAKYFTWATEEGSGKHLTAYGLETYDQYSKFLFVVEGIFDCIKIHNAGYPAIATLTNSPSKGMLSWLRTLPQRRIVILDNDENASGLKLKRAGDVFYMTPDPYGDLGDMPQNEVNEFLRGLLKQNRLK